MSNIYNYDARKLQEKVKTNNVNVTITSPPYFDLKDYGHPDQIGYGQEYQNYLNDLQLVFKQVYNVTKEDGSLWVIIDAFRKNGQVVTLPFDLSNKLKEVGWKLQDIIIWKKDRTVPWYAKGQTRNIFEYILVFSKGTDFKYYVDRVRDHEELKKWWVKYPERYNPHGKSPTGVWDFNIPVQGSWGNNYIRHFCPLPEGLIERIIHLTTDEKDIVLDPFAGSGAVLSKACWMNREYIGFELNKKYIEMFTKYCKQNYSKKREEYYQSKKNQVSREDFSNTIFNLRSIKFARILHKELKPFKNQIKSIYVNHYKKNNNDSRKPISSEYSILVNKGVNKKEVLKEIEKVVSIKPLCKFGINPNFVISDNEKEFIKSFKRVTVYEYTGKTTNKFTSKFLGTIDTFKILSPIRLDIEEPVDYHE